MVMLVLAGIGAFAGVLAIAAGIPVKEFGVGSTLILAGVLSCCTSFILIGMWVGVKDLRAAMRRPPQESDPAGRHSEAPHAASIQPPQAIPAPPPRAEPQPQPTAYVPQPVPVPVPPLQAQAQAQAQPQPQPPADTPIMMPPWQEAVSQRERQPLFGGGSAEGRLSRGVSLRARIEREAAAMSEAEAGPSPFAPPDSPPRRPSDEPRPVQQRGRGDAQRPPRTPTAVIEPRDPPIVSTPVRELSVGVADRDGAATSIVPGVAPARPPRAEAGVAVTVLKSGVVDGMAYWLYSDGSIEAQMPEGMMRFTSIEELRTHLDRRA